MFWNGKLRHLVAVVFLAVLSGAAFSSDFALFERRHEAMLPERYGWAKGEVTWFYDPTNEPKIFKWGALSQIFVAMLTWEHACNVKFTYAGEIDRSKHIALDGASIVGWESEDSTYYGWAVAWIIRGKVREADVVLNTRHVVSDRDLYNTILHEVGHMIGLPHSTVEATLMSGPPFTSYYWPGYVTPIDAEDCIRLYGPAHLEQ